MTVQQSTCSINASTNLNIQRAINIQKTQLSISNSLVVTSKATNIQRVNSVINSFLTLDSSVINIKSSKTNLSNVSSQISLSEIKIYNTIKATINCASNLECYYYDRDIQEALVSYIPDFFRESSIFSQLLKVQGNEVTKYNALLDAITLQLFVDTATWGLDLWEKELGIITNLELSYEERRTKIKFRLQLKNKIITKKFFDSVMNRYYESDIEEDFTNSKINITVVNKTGISLELSEMMSDADELLPAHMDYLFNVQSTKDVSLTNSCNSCFNDYQQSNDMCCGVFYGDPVNLGRLIKINTNITTSANLNFNDYPECGELICGEVNI